MINTVIDYVFFACFVFLTIHIIASFTITLIQRIKQRKSNKKLTAGQYAFDEFLDRKGHLWRSHNLLAPSMDTDTAIEIIRLHFAENFVVPYSCSKEQFNTEVVHYILSNYKGNKV